MLQISSIVSMSLCYLSWACHLRFCDARMGFLVVVMGVGCHLCLLHLKVALMLP